MPSCLSGSQLEPGECGDIKLFMTNVLKLLMNANAVGFTFLPLCIRMQPKKFSSGSWFKFRGHR